MSLHEVKKAKVLLRKVVAPLFHNNQLTRSLE